MTPEGRDTPKPERPKGNQRHNQARYCYRHQTPGQNRARQVRRAVEKDHQQAFGTKLSGRQWKKLVKAMRREEAAIRRGELQPVVRAVAPPPAGPVPPPAEAVAP